MGYDIWSIFDACCTSEHPFFSRFNAEKGLHVIHACVVYTPFYGKPWFLHVCSTSLLKALWEKEKMMVTSILSISHHVLKNLHSHCCKPFPKHALVLRVCSTDFLKTPWEKEKLLVMIDFSFSHSVFYPFWKPSSIFIQFEIVICKLFQFWSVWNFSLGKGLNVRLVC